MIDIVAEKQNSIPKIIHQTWKDEIIPPQFDILANTWKEKHPDWQYILWTDEMNRSLIADSFPGFLPRYDSFKHNIQRVDAARYFILYKFGGLYADLDFECLKDLTPLLENTTCLLGREPEEHCRIHQQDMILSNALMACTPGNNFIKQLCDEVYKVSDSKQSVNDHILSSTGPFMLTRIYNQYTVKETLRLAAADELYALTKMEIDILLNGGEIDETVQKKLDEAYAIHYYWGTWWK